MDKQFLRFLMLSVLLFAGANLARAIDRDFVAPAVVSHSFVSRFADNVDADSVRKPSIEGRRFMKVIAAEENAVLRRRSD
jgi:hypothetical protein